MVDLGPCQREEGSQLYNFPYTDEEFLGLRSIQHLSLTHVRELTPTMFSSLFLSDSVLARNLRSLELKN